MTHVQDTAEPTREQSDEALQSFVDGFASPPRSPVLHWPSEHGLEYEDITFPARDGLLLIIDPAAPLAAPGRYVETPWRRASRTMSTRPFAPSLARMCEI